MGFREVDIKNIQENFAKIIGDEWMLLTAGERGGFNTMTASWGGIGEMWGGPAAFCVVRPTRYTNEFLQNNDYFSLSFYGDDKQIHKICGNKSGRDVDKVKETGLIPVFDENTVYFEQARLVIICKKVFAQEMTENCFTDKSFIDTWYPERDLHFTYIGHIEKVLIKE